VACVGMKCNMFTILMRNSSGKGPLGRPVLRWECNSLMVLKPIRL